MVARKYTAKRLYSGGSNNKKEQLQTSINELLTQLDVSSNEPYIKALRAALLFIQSAIESKTITKQQKKQSNEIAKNLNTTKPSSNNKSSNMGSQITELFKPKNLSMNKAAKVVNTAEGEVANTAVSSNNIKSRLETMVRDVATDNRTKLMNELDTVDLNKDSIKGLFTGKDKNEQLKLLATLLQLTGKDIPQVGGTNKSSSSSSFKNNFSSTSAANAGFSGPGGRQAFAETLGNKFFGQPPSKSENTSEAKKSGTPKPIPFLSKRPPMNPREAMKSVLGKITRENSVSNVSSSVPKEPSTQNVPTVSNVSSSVPKEPSTQIVPSVSNVPLSVSNEPSKSSNNNKKQQMINNLKSILTPEFIKELKYIFFTLC